MQQNLGSGHRNWAGKSLESMQLACRTSRDSRQKLVGSPNSSQAMIQTSSTGLLIRIGGDTMTRLQAGTFRAVRLSQFQQLHILVEAFSRPECLKDNVDIGMRNGPHTISVPQSLKAFTTRPSRAAASVDGALSSQRLSCPYCSELVDFSAPHDMSCRGSICPQPSVMLSEMEV